MDSPIGLGDVNPRRIRAYRTHRGISKLKLLSNELISKFVLPFVEFSDKPHVMLSEFSINVLFAPWAAGIGWITRHYQPPNTISVAVYSHAV